MLAGACEPAVLQHENQIAVFDGIDPLGDRQNCQIPIIALQGLHQIGIGQVVKSGQRVVQNQKLGALDQCAGNGQSLFLSA